LEDGGPVRNSDITNAAMLPEETGTPKCRRMRRSLL